MFTFADLGYTILGAGFVLLAQLFAPWTLTLIGLLGASILAFKNYTDPVAKAYSEKIEDMKDEIIRTKAKIAVARQDELDREIVRAAQRMVKEMNRHRKRGCNRQENPRSARHSFEWVSPDNEGADPTQTNTASNNEG
ncbi:hypothetical protein C7212DRAFT_364602 [Tuber magnatum]|uniref:Uncharacterized protein n=1 Tax=Tuber magnatum TaxID=42249 RepID=A0A317SKB5_9PEZI|nr:hypothetical protein C7212DRAFT_364602 [Tuber magnatum]